MNSMERLKDTNVGDAVRHSQGVQQEIIMSRRIGVRKERSLEETDLQQ